MELWGKACICRRLLWKRDDEMLYGKDLHMVDLLRVSGPVIPSPFCACDALLSFPLTVPLCIA